MHLLFGNILIHLVDGERGTAVDLGKRKAITLSGLSAALLPVICRGLVCRGEKAGQRIRERVWWNVWRRLTHIRTEA